MTIARRQFMGLGALGVGAVALDGCAGLFKTASAPRSDEVDRLLRDLDRVVASIQDLEPDVKRFGIRPRGREVEAGRSLATRLLTTLCFMGTYRDVPETMWQEPRIAERLAKTLPQINATINAARKRLADLDDLDAKHIDQRLKDDPNLTMRIMERVDEYAHQIDVPIEQRTYLRTATAQLAGRFRFEGTKEVTSKLASQYQRLLRTRVNALGMEGEVDTGSDQQQQQQQQQQQYTQPTPLHTSFHTHAEPRAIRAAACGIEPVVLLDGAKRTIRLDWDEFRCATTVPDDQLIRGTVHMEPGPNGDNVVTVVIYPPDTTSEAVLSSSLVQITEELERRLATGLQCTTSDDCGPLRCISGVCRDPFAKPSIPAPVVEARRGERGESCRTKSDCEGELTCAQNTCRTEEELPSSAKLIHTTRQVAKWGAILLIPPICAVGVLVLLVCFFMVIVAGCMYAGGD